MTSTSMKTWRKGTSRFWISSLSLTSTSCWPVQSSELVTWIHWSELIASTRAVGAAVPFAKAGATCFKADLDIVAGMVLEFVDEEAGVVDRFDGGSANSLCRGCRTYEELLDFFDGLLIAGDEQGGGLLDPFQVVDRIEESRIGDARGHQVLHEVAEDRDQLIAGQIFRVVDDKGACGRALDGQLLHQGREHRIFARAASTFSSAWLLPVKSRELVSLIHLTLLMASASCLSWTFDCFKSTANVLREAISLSGAAVLDFVEQECEIADALDGSEGSAGVDAADQGLYFVECPLGIR